MSTTQFTITTPQSVEDVVEEFHNLWDELRMEEDEFARYCKGDISNWLRTTLTKVAEEARKDERKKVVEWAKTHDMPDNMPDDALAGYNEALVRLIAHLSDK